MSAWPWFLAGVLSCVAVRLALAYAERLVRARAWRQRARLLTEVKRLERAFDRLRAELEHVRAERDRLQVEWCALREAHDSYEGELAKTQAAPDDEEEETDPGLPAVLGGRGGGS